MSYSNLSDAELLEQWRGGATAAGGALVRRYHPRIRRVFCINSSSSDWIADMVQRTFLAFCERRDHIEDPQKVKSYLLGIANNLLREHFKTKHRRRGEHPVDIDEVTLADVDGPGFTTWFSNRQERALLEKALRRVPIQDQLILQHKYWDELTNREIAEITKIPVGTLAGRLAAAKQRLAAQVRRLDKLGHAMRAAAGSDEPERAASVGTEQPEHDRQCAPPLRLVR